MTREEWERRLYEKLAGWVFDAVSGSVRHGPHLAKWIDQCSTDLKATIGAAWQQAQPQVQSPTLNKESTNGNNSTPPGKAPPPSQRPAPQARAS